MRETEVLIVGGGISGLATAWWLARQGVAVEVWEAGDLPGGKIRTTRDAGYLTEQAAGLLVNFRPEVDQLLHACGASEKRVERPGRLNRYLLHQSQLASVPMQLSAIAASPLWNWQAKLRMLGEVLIPKGGHPGETVSQFITRRLGRAVLDTAMDPFITGTLSSDPAKAEATSVLPRLTALEQRYGSLALGMLVNMLWRRRRANNADTFSFTGGMSDLINAIVRSDGLNLRCGVEVAGIEQTRKGWRAISTDGRQRSVYALVLSTPANVTASLLRDTSRTAANLLAGIEYAPVAVAHLGFKRKCIGHPLDGTGFLVPSRESLSFNGNLWMSRLFPDRAPPGQTLLTSYLGGSLRPRQIELDDQTMMEVLLRDLSPLLDINGEPEYFRVDRHHQGLPMYHGNYQERLSGIQAEIGECPGLYLAANYLGGVSVRERIHQGRLLADTISATLKRYVTDRLHIGSLIMAQ
jgi:oxygen-dependent protoporphyrinogen oxidase